MNQPLTSLRQLQAQPITPQAFRPYGQAIFPTADHKPFDGDDAQLVLDRGTPRLWIMRLPGKGMKFNQITHHTQCTQCLGSLQGKEWFMGVAPPGDELLVDQIVAFQVPGDCFLKLEMGTWHAGPYFAVDEVMDFYNLELADTNLADHETIDLWKTYNLEFEILPIRPPQDPAEEESPPPTGHS